MMANTMSGQTAYASKFVSISPELVELNTAYTFTLNPSDKYQFFNEDSPRLRVGRVAMMMDTLLLKMSKVCSISVDTEVSKMGRIHFHGIIVFKDIANFYITFADWLKEYGTYEIDVLTDKLIWEVYCLKSNHLFICKLSTPSNRYVSIKRDGVVHHDINEWCDKNIIFPKGIDNATEDKVPKKSKSKKDH